MTTKILTGTYTAGYSLKTGFSAVYLSGTGSISGYGLAVDLHAPVNVINDGTISAILSESVGGHPENKVGVYLYYGGQVTNHGVIRGNYGVVSGPTSSNTGVVTNTGSIIVGIDGVELGRSGSAVYNEPLAIISAGKYGVVGGTLTNVYNGGLIEVSQYSTGAAIGVTGGEVTNYGTLSLISSNGGHSSAKGISAGAGSTIHNAGSITTPFGVVLTSGYLANRTTGLINTIYAGVTATDSTLVNQGVIESRSSAGVSLVNGGLLTNGSLLNTAAQIKGLYGVLGTSNGPVETVVNYGSILSSYVSKTGKGAPSCGVSLANGGYVYNGRNGDTVALIDAYQAVSIRGAAGTVANYGTIESSTARDGVELFAGGNVYNGIDDSRSALIEGARGVQIYGGGHIYNYGSILGEGHSGVLFNNGGVVFNGAPNDATAAISGSFGVLGYGSTTVFNYGIIRSNNPEEGGVSILNNAQPNSGFIANGEGALIDGRDGVFVTGGIRVLNYGTIAGHRGWGVYALGGTVTNGVGAASAALIVGLGGVLEELSATVTNIGVINGSNYLGVDLLAGGKVTNGGGGQVSALIEGSTAVSLFAGGAVANYGTLAGVYGAGVALVAGGSVTNGGGTNKMALIRGTQGVEASGAAASVKNLGTILASGGAGDYAVTLGAGGTFQNGSATDKAALAEGYGGLALTGGSATNFGAVRGDGADGANLSGASVFTNGAIGHAGALVYGYFGLAASGAATVTNFGTIDGEGGVAVSFTSATGVLNVEAGSAFVGRVLGGGGTLDLASGTGTISGFTGAALVVSGSMAAATFQNFGVVEVGAGASFADTGAVTVASGQTVEAMGNLTLGGAQGSIVNGGTLAVAGGTMTVSGAVTGTGHAAITGGTLDLASSFTQNVTFTKTGVLELAQSQGYTGTITTFSKTGGTSLDLVDIGFVSPTEATFSGTTTSGVLTVTDGTHTAHITLKGNYTTSIFVASSDGHGGTIVVDPKAKAPTAPPHQLIAAMAGLGSSAGQAIYAREGRAEGLTLLARPHPLPA